MPAYPLDYLPLPHDPGQIERERDTFQPWKDGFTHGDPRTKEKRQRRGEVPAGASERLHWYLDELKTIGQEAHGGRWILLELRDGVLVGGDLIPDYRFVSRVVAETAFGIPSRTMKRLLAASGAPHLAGTALADVDALNGRKPQTSGAVLRLLQGVTSGFPLLRRPDLGLR